MKKLFTLVALLAMFMGAKAEVVQDYKVDYSTYTGFPFYVMGYVPEWNDGVMTDMGAMYKYVTTDNTDGESSDVTVKTNSSVEYYRISLSEAGWHQYFIADGIPTELDGSYTVKAMVKASEACTIGVNMGWGWGEGQTVSAQVSIGTDWQEVEWEYSGIGGTSCNLVAQPGTTTAQIEWKYVTVEHTAKAQKPVTWLEQLTNGDAEKAWDDATVKFNDTENNYKICAWAKENGKNTNDDGGSEPFPATIEDDGTGNHVFVVHATACTDPTADASAWDNQFWIESPKSWKSGTQIKIHFRYKASQACKTNTQIHKQNPSDYLHWQAVGDVNFTTEWQEFDKTFTFEDAMSGGWSIAFNLNPDVKTATDFYFDDLSWQIMKLDEGYFVAGCNTTTGLDYDFDNAIEFTESEEEGEYVATIGTKGDKDTWVSQVMISTTRGNDAAFKGATLKPTSAIVNGETLDYTASGLAKLNLPAAGVWTITLIPEVSKICFDQVEGEAIKEAIEINPNPTVFTIPAVERDYLGANSNGEAQEAEIGTGNAWDNQFWIFANRAITEGEETTIEFDYVASKDAKTTTQIQGLVNDATTYLFWSAIGDVNFTTEEQHFSKTFSFTSSMAVASTDNGDVTNHGIAFNMAEIKEACDYTIKNVVWKLSDNTESLIDQTGDKNFYLKVGAGTAPGTWAGISNVVAESNANAAIYNLAGQRVSKNYKGIVVKGGNKYIAK